MPQVVPRLQLSEFMPVYWIPHPICVGSIRYYSVCRQPSRHAHVPVDQLITRHKNWRQLVTPKD